MAKKTFYVSFDLQGQTECVIRVKARDEDEAELLAYRVMFGEYDTCVDRTKPNTDDVMVLDEDGEEI